MAEDDDLDPDATDIMVPELITLGALGTSLYGDRWLSSVAEDMGVRKSVLHAVVRGGTITKRMRQRVRDWAVDACRRDLEQALSRVTLFRAVEAAWEPED